MIIGTKSPKWPADAVALSLWVLVVFLGDDIATLGPKTPRPSEPKVAEVTGNINSPSGSLGGDGEQSHSCSHLLAPGLV